ncbi:hypothetical protein [Gloeobacter kilaueensis]|uniref:hypothetical protein n=1 Tax=Gloeobacter kilaueensis TaxID=1416614 RepID=UPI00068561AC|nr:hypothetical protein [Gloeobacter kilaueensis]
MFNLLSIGQRGVGKTVFLAGSYTELRTSGITDSRLPLWFDCKDSQSQQNIEKILGYIERTGAYPPGTMKITDFDFRLKRRGLMRPVTLCDFRLQDLPGESCHIANPAFRQIVLGSHGCCVCIDGYALIHSDTYLDELRDVLVQVLSIASLVHLNGLKYAFALLLTKSDLLGEIPDSEAQIRQKLQPLTNRLDAIGSNYQIFRTGVPLVHEGEGVRLAPSGAAAPLLWLVLELNRAHNPGVLGSLFRLVRRLLPRRLQGRSESPLQNLFGSTAASQDS